MMDNEYTMSNQTEENNRDPLDFHKQITVVDCHCDTLLDVMNKGRRLCNYSEEGHVDLVRLQQGGVNVQFFAAFIETVYKPDQVIRTNKYVLPRIRYVWRHAGPWI